MSNFENVEGFTVELIDDDIVLTFYNIAEEADAQYIFSIPDAEMIRDAITEVLGQKKHVLK